MAKDLQNPFIHIRNWIKGEMFCLGSLIMAISEKESCDVRKQKAINKLADDREYNKKLAEGKFAFKSMFKSGKKKMEA